MEKIQSRYGGGMIMPAQYIVELICEKKAFCDKKHLPNQFWDLAEWHMFFKKWVRPANKFVKEFGAEAVINALQDKKSGKRWSLYTEAMVKLIKEHAKKIKEQEKLAKKHKDYNIDISSGKNIRQHIPQTQMFDLLDVEYSNVSIIDGKTAD